MDVFKDSHQVTNQVPPLNRQNAYEDDIPLKESLHATLKDNAFIEMISKYGSRIAQLDKWGVEANLNLPRLTTHDRYGFRIDTVEYHPAYHTLMQTATQFGLHCLPWQQRQPHGHLIRMALEYIHAQAEAGTACPLSMTYAGIPLLLKHSQIARTWLPKALINDYDPSNKPIQEKKSITLGMAMTEKQGGSDVRANLTAATPAGDHYELVGHKWFCSAPMSDGFFVTAQAKEGLSCFLVPRWRPDGDKNAMHLMRLKNKLGNQANASSEVEFQGALGWLIGEPGKGIQTIIQMVALTRFDCMVGSTAIQRAAWVQAYHHALHRKAFGQRLIDQPLMRNVLAHAALEIEANLLMCVHLAELLDQNNPEDHRLRLLTALGKFWICKNTSMMVAELLECLGGAGFIEDFVLARFYREAPLNAIWEGCGNIQCLDVLRTLSKDPEAFEQIKSVIEKVPQLKVEMNFDELQARRSAQLLFRQYQTAVLFEKAPNWLAEAFLRQNQMPTALLGSIDDKTVVDGILQRHAKSLLE